MKAYWGVVWIHILDLGTNWRWVVTFTPRLLYPLGKETTGTHSIGGWVRHKACLDEDMFYYLGKKYCKYKKGIGNAHPPFCCTFILTFWMRGNMWILLPSLGRHWELDRTNHNTTIAIYRIAFLWPNHSTPFAKLVTGSETVVCLKVNVGFDFISLWNLNFCSTYRSVQEWRYAWIINHVICINMIVINSCVSLLLLVKHGIKKVRFIYACSSTGFSGIPRDMCSEQYLSFIWNCLIYLVFPVPIAFIYFIWHS
jgi:hypothetical protein